MQRDTPRPSFNPRRMKHILWDGGGGTAVGKPHACKVHPESITCNVQHGTERKHDVRASDRELQCNRLPQNSTLVHQVSRPQVAPTDAIDSKDVGDSEVKHTTGLILLKFATRNGVTTVRQRAFSEVSGCVCHLRASCYRLNHTHLKSARHTR